MFDFREFPAQILMQQEWLSLLYPSCQRTIINYCTERHCDCISIEFHFLLDAFFASGSDLCANKRTQTRSNFTLFSWNDIGFALNASSFFSTLQPVCKCFHLHSANRIFSESMKCFALWLRFLLHLVYMDLVDLNIVATAAAAASFRLINSFWRWLFVRCYCCCCCCLFLHHHFSLLCLHIQKRIGNRLNWYGNCRK